MNDTVEQAVTAVMSLLVMRQYDELESLSNGIRLSSGEIAKAISDYGRTLAPYLYQVQ